ncbi:MAG: TrkH family potassium uptake protein [Spirochaetales bacterium]|nr:TrkH family potassium uptake protein [Spirochaetales bacterium]
MVNLRYILWILLLVTLVIAAMMLVPSVMAWKLGEQEALRAFLATYAAAALFVAAALPLTRRLTSKTMRSRDGYLAVTLSWVAAAALSALPLFLSAACPDFTTAFFEAMSGLTTTSATALLDVEVLPRSILFWRSMTNWLGGMGIVVLFVALLPVLGQSASLLVGAETVGPTKDKLTPKIKNTALILWSIYLGFSLVQTALLRLGGLGLYEAVTITFSTMSTAGFSVTNTSIAGYASPYIETVIIIFMLASATNFALYYKALTGRISAVFKDGELRAFLGIWAIVTLVGSFNLLSTHTYSTVAEALRYSSFQTASILTTTGFTSADYLSWPIFNQLLLFMLFFVGGCSGSTGSGMKVIRVATLFKMGRAQMKSRIHPRGVFQVRVGQRTITRDLQLSIATFFGIYILTGIVASVIFSLSAQADLLTAISSAFLFLGNVGVGFGAAGPGSSFALLEAPLKWFASALMLVGRLELFTVYVLFTGHFWRR